MGLITLKEAAERLGVSLPTVRRMIKDGRLNGELRDGPYGRTYYIDEANIRTAQEITDVVPVVRPVSVETLADAVAARVADIVGTRVQETLTKAMEASAEEQARTRAELEALAEKEARTQEELETLRQELAGTRAELAAAIEALKKLTEKEERRPWWRRLFK